MKRFLYGLLLTFFLSPCSIKAQVQNGNEIVVEISKEKTVINGILYYLHTVKKGENIYRISLAYGLTQQALLQVNPEIINGIIKEGQILKIPVTTVVTAPQTEKHLQKYKTYKVKQHDTEYSIARQYSLSVNELIAANSELSQGDLKTGEEIRIPVYRGVDIIQKPGSLPKDSLLRRATVPYYQPYSQPFSQLSFDTAQFNDTFYIAMLLPFFLEENNSPSILDTLTDPYEPEKKVSESNEIYQRTLNFIEFYQGALIAVDSLIKKGIKIKLFTYDASRDTIKIQRILDKPEMKLMNLIIGPFYSDPVIQVGRFALANKIKMISPVWNNCSLLKSNPYLFEIIPSDSEYVETMINYIASIPNKNIIFVSSNNQNDKNISKLFKDRLDHYYQNQYKQYLYNDNSFQINSLLLNTRTNIIILPTEDEGIASNILRMLNLLVNNDSIKVFGLPIALKWKNVEIECFHNLEFHFYSSFFADYKNNKELNKFLVKYEKYNFTQPYFHTRENYPYLLTKEGYNFSYLGYDITFYFLSALCTYGPSFENYFNQQKIQLIHSNFDFERVSDGGGFINKGVNIMKFTQDFNILKVN